MTTHFKQDYYDQIYFVICLITDNFLRKKSTIFEQKNSIFARRLYFSIHRILSSIPTLAYVNISSEVASTLVKNI